MAASKAPPHMIAGPLRLSRFGQCRGFTAIELLVVVSIVAIFAAIAAPGMQSFIGGQRIKALAYDLTADLMLARSEALKRNSTVSITRSGTSWDTGWVTNTGGVTLSTRNAAGGSFTFTGAPQTITFGANGRVTLPTDPVRISISGTSASANSQRCVELDLSGRARSSVGACS